MTDTASKAPHSRRLKDQGFGGRVRSFWREWGGFITGCWLIIVSVAVFAVAVAFVRDQNATDRAARSSCERSRVFGPALAVAYAKYRILTPAQIKVYREGIPTRCPS